MAMIGCPDCGTNVSDAAIACPNCCRPIAATPPEQQRVIITRFEVPFGALVGFLVKLGFAAVPAMAIFFFCWQLIATFNRVGR